MNEAALVKLQALSAAKTLPHAWLFVGEQSQTKEFADNFISWLLCNNKQHAHACGTCKACNLLAANTHPDFFSLTPPAEKNIMQIDDVRMTTEFVTSKPQLSQQKVVLIYPAEAMSKQSANALLKNLEEPTSETKFILLAKHHELLLKTIISRCQILNFSAVNTQQSDLQSNNIIQQMSKDLIQLWVHNRGSSSQIAESWIQSWSKDTLQYFDIVLTDIIRFKYTHDATLVKNWCNEYTVITAKVHDHKLWATLQQLRQAQAWLAHNHNPNLQLLLEDML